MSEHKMASAPYLGFTPKDTDEYAIERFVARYGEPPAEVFVQGTMKYAGPIPLDKSGKPVTPKLVPSGRM